MLAKLEAVGKEWPGQVALGHAQKKKKSKSRLYARMFWLPKGCCMWILEKTLLSHLSLSVPTLMGMTQPQPRGQFL